MRELPAITLIIPSHRRGAKLGPTLASVYAQTRIPDEVIVVNDGSFPETTDFIKEHYTDVRLFNIEQSGVAAARNYGAISALHPTLIFLDDDDTLLPHAVETLAALQVQFPEARSFHTDHTFTNHATGEHWPRHHGLVPNFDRLQQVPVHAQRGNARLYGKALYYELLKGNLLQQPWLVDRATYLAVGGYRANLVSADDWDLYLRLTRAYQIVLSDAIISDHYIEVDRPHLTLNPRQREGQIAAASRQLGHVVCRSPYATIGLLRLIAGLHKSAGDQHPPSLLKWWHYGRSMLHWPFDHVVVIRTLFAIPIAMLWPHKTHSTEATT